jgi:glucokinase
LEHFNFGLPASDFRIQKTDNKNILKMKELTAGIDIGGTGTKIGLVDNEGNILIENKVKTPEYPDIDEFVSALTWKIKECLDKLGSGYKLRGIGIGAPNGNFYKGTIEFAPNLPWRGTIELVQKMKHYFDVPIVMTNDANAAAMGEMIYGKAKGLKDFIVITLGTGLGSGIVTDGKVVYGHDGFAGEIGHTTYDPNGRLCGCGKKGCLETYASATGIVLTVGELLLKSTVQTKLREIPANKLEAKDIHQEALKGDRLALEAFDYTARILGLKLADSIAHTSPEAIFLFGGLAEAGDYILVPTKKYMEENLLTIFRNKVRLEISGLMGKNAAILGAAALIG